MWIKLAIAPRFAVLSAIGLILSGDASAIALADSTSDSIESLGNNAAIALSSRLADVRVAIGL